MPFKFYCFIAVLACLNWFCAFSAEPAPVLSAQQAASITAQIRKLNAPDNIEREEAERELLKIGQAALPMLKDASVSPEPEVAARAKRLVSKLSETALKPIQSYAEAMPANSVFFLEAPHARETLDRLKDAPLGKFWDLPATQKFYRGHHDGELPAGQKMLDAIRGIPKLLNGRALLALGAPETAEAVELEPPLIYLLESAQPQALEQQARALFEGMTDPTKGSRHYGPFTIEEHITAQTVFGQDSVIHSLTQAGIEAFLNNMLKRPEKSLTPALAGIRALLPEHDFLMHLSSDGFKQLSDAAQLIDDEQIKLLDTAGFVAGSTFQSALKVNSDGFEEADLLSVGGGAKNEGLLAVLVKMAAAMPPPVAAGSTQALDLIPWQAGILISLQGDTARNAAPLAKAIKAIDELYAPEPQHQAAKPNDPKEKKPVVPVAPPGAGAGDLPETLRGDNKALGRQALAAAAGAERKDPDAKNEPVAAAVPAGVYPHVSRFEKLGLKLDQFFEHIDGPMQLALFMQQIDQDAPPDSMPISPLFAVLLKDPKPIEQTLEASAAGPAPRFGKEVLNGGVHYVDLSGDKQSKPGYWLKDNYLAYSTERDLLELASNAVAHKGGNERMADRASYKQAWTSKRLSQEAVLTVFGDADQALEMPYKLAQINWQEDDANPWPDYKQVKTLLLNKPILLQFRSAPNQALGGLQANSQTPLGMLGVIHAFCKTLKEAGF